MQNTIEKNFQTNKQQSNIPDWIDEEMQTMQTPLTGERLPSLKLEAGKVIRFTIDFSNKFQKWSNQEVTKAIIPVLHKGERKNFWLNVRNPLYREICERGKKGQTEFVVSTAGSQKDTRYTIVEEE